MAKRRKPQLQVILGAIGTFIVLIALGFSGRILGRIQAAYSSYRIEALIRAAETHARPTKARISGEPYSRLDSNMAVSDDLGRAQVFLLGLPTSARTEYLQSLIDFGMGNWNQALQILAKLTSEDASNARYANDLGVAYMASAENDAVYLFKALEQFERAEQLNPNAPEPHFNRLLTLRRLHLSHQEELERGRYDQLEHSGPWHIEAFNQPVAVEEQVAALLQNAVDRGDDAAALKVFRESPEISRNIAMRYGMNPADSAETEKLAAYIANIISKNYGDETVVALLHALDEADRSRLVAARALVAEGANRYLKDDLKGSLESYDEAAKALVDIPSPFDHLWLQLNRAITEIRTNNIDSAQSDLEHIVGEARQRRYKWLLSSALSTYGSLRALNADFTEMMDRLEEAVRISDEIGAPRASARARFFMLGQKYIGGDLDGALQVSIDCLNVIDSSEHLRIGSVLAYLDVILYKKGFFQQAVTVGDEAVSQAVDSHNPMVLEGATTSLGLIAELTDQQSLSDEALSRAEQSARETQGSERAKSEIAIDNTRGRILLHRGNIDAAVLALEQSRKAFDQSAIPSTSLKSETLTLLGQAYARNGKFNEARDAFRNAIDAEEQDNNFAKTEHSRVAFDDARRELFESAIDFEYEQGSKDAAWSYLQKYRAKAFIEILAQFNPAIEKVHSIALDRSEAQKAIPGGMQIVEYALLPDRILIWFLTNDKFETRSVAIGRDVIEERVQEFLADLREGKPVIRGNAALYNILIRPIIDLLQTDRPLAIIPDRALHGLPFGAIECPEHRYLIQYYPIIESPTLTHLLAVDKGEVKRDSIVTFGSRTEDVAENREIGAIKTIYRKVYPFTGPQVTKTMFLDQMEHAPIFHYAGHSAHDAADPLRSAILLDGDKGGPNSVTAVDIVSRKLLPNSLVILSSCDSSVGNSKDGVGIRGLTSAFLVSGASAVVGSLWPVESTSTSDLMIRFHKSFATERLPIAQALRKAQLAFIESNSRRSHPYYWSGFVVTSNFSALR